jgi:NAD dependent epimerase/dehydratase
MKKVFLTGADGFIGSHLAERLVRDGYHVRALAQYNSFNSWGWLDSAPLKNQMEVVTGDVRDPFAMKTFMQGCEAVLHLAALIAIPYSYHAPASYVDTNISGTLNIVQAARELEISKVVHTSTSEVYGTARYVPIDEVHPLQGQSPYSASKIAADQMAISYYNSFETPVAIIRPFNTYGPRQSARAVIPTIISQIANGKREIKLGALKPTRDFNYVADTVGGFISVLESQNSVGEVINIGSNFEISIGDLVKTIAEVMGVEVSIITDDQRIRPANSEVERLWAENKKAKELIGWVPEFSGIDGLRRGLAETVEWFTQKNNLAQYKSEVYNV